MRRGDVVVFADRLAGEYAGTPRPAVVIQADNFPGTDSLTVAPMTGFDSDTPLVRLRIEPSATLPLTKASYVMVDKIVTIRRNRVGAVIGPLARDDVIRLDRSLVIFFGIG